MPAIKAARREETEYGGAVRPLLFDLPAPKPPHIADCPILPTYDSTGEINLRDGPSGIDFAIARITPRQRVQLFCTTRAATEVSAGVSGRQE